MNRKRVSPALGQLKMARRATRNSHDGSPMRGTSQNDKPTDEPDTGPYVRTATGVKFKCIRNTHG